MPPATLNERFSLTDKNTYIWEFYIFAKQNKTFKNVDSFIYTFCRCFPQGEGLSVTKNG
jgi:hypothetical protein